MSAERARFTLDTNLLVCSVDSAAGPRHRAALEIVDRAAESECWLTLQALSEFYVAVTRKGIVRSTEAAAQAADWLELFPTVPASASAIRAALAEAAVGRASYWDALLVATAGEAGCTIVLTEDMSDGSIVGGLEIHNPIVSTGGLTEMACRLLRLSQPHP